MNAEVECVCIERNAFYLHKRAIVPWFSPTRQDITSIVLALQSHIKGIRGTFQFFTLIFIDCTNAPIQRSLELERCSVPKKKRFKGILLMAGLMKRHSGQVFCCVSLVPFYQSCVIVNSSVFSTLVTDSKVLYLLQ